MNGGLPARAGLRGACTWAWLLLLAALFVTPLLHAQPGGGPQATALLTRDVRMEFEAVAPSLEGKSVSEAKRLLSGLRDRLRALSAQARAGQRVHRVVVFVGYVRAVEPGTTNAKPRRRTENFVLLADNWAAGSGAAGGMGVARAYPGERSQCTGTMAPPPRAGRDSTAQLMVCAYPR